MDPDEEEWWCARCERNIRVIDQSTEVVQERNGQRGYHVTWLECGHQLTRPDGTFYPFG